ncbi:cytochrome P450 4V2 [Caerostris extrusa]|uniref:Cytochrome P450 4V2 n=1 Tax=Caerostris extrusa TaxID=172846 RepID=A0AAV4WUW1_CAEEX|nr:cytochrome P450 4V2 [Caerostris extrusa]
MLIAFGSLANEKSNRKSWMYYFFQATVGTGLFTCDSTQWKDRRKLFAPCFQSNMLKGYLTVFNEHSHKFVKHLMKETENEFTIVDEPISLSTLDIVCECVMGVKLSELENKGAQYVQSLHRYVTETDEVIQERKQRYLNGEKGDDSIKYKSLLEVLLKLHIEDQALDEKGVRQEVDTFIIAVGSN